MVVPIETSGRVIHIEPIVANRFLRIKLRLPNHIAITVVSETGWSTCDGSEKIMICRYFFRANLHVIALLVLMLGASPAVAQISDPVSPSDLVPSAAPQFQQPLGNLQQPILQQPAPTPPNQILDQPQSAAQPFAAPQAAANQPPAAIQPGNIPNQQPFAAPSANLASALSLRLGATAGSFSAAPTMIGDFFGGGFSTLSGSQTVSFARFARANNISAGGGPGSANSILAFEVGTDTVFNDVFSIGTGLDVAGGGDGADTFTINEPVPPSDAPTAPGPNFTFDGGTAVYTNNTTDTTAQPGIYQDGEFWYLQYSYTSAINGAAGTGGLIALPAPGNASRRVKLSENFSPEVRDRVFFNYSFFNDSFGGLGDISRYLLGVERLLCEDVSFEARLPVAGTYASSQQINSANAQRF